MKRLYKQILLALFIVLLLLLTYSQYKEKKMYESVLSNQLQYDIISFAQSIIQNSSLYEQIMESGEISLQQADSLARSNDALSSAFANYAMLAVDLNRSKDGFQYNQTSLNAQKMALYFSHWEENHGNEPVPLDARAGIIITEFQALNSKWVHTVEASSAFSIDKDNVSYSPEEHPSITNSYWLELLVNLEDATTGYLSEATLEHIGQLY